MAVDLEGRDAECGSYIEGLTCNRETEWKTDNLGSMLQYSVYAVQGVN